MNPTDLLLTADPAGLLLLGAGVVALIKNLLLAILAVLNGILAMLATLAVWKSYLLTGVKIALTAMVVVPVVGIVAYFVWAQQKVQAAS